MELFLSTLFFLGLCTGSFLNVAIFRFGFSERAAPRSRCMACDRPIGWYDLVPVVSFFALRGRCRACGSALSIQYPIVELSLGALFLLVGLVVPPMLSFWSIAAFVALLVFLLALTGLVVYDVRHTLVPMPFVYVLLAAAAAAAACQSIATASFAPFFDSTLGGATLFIFFFVIYLLTRGKGMGAGDAYVAAAIGILLGFSRGIEAIAIGVWTGTILALLFLALSALLHRSGLFASSGQVTMKTELPLVPFLAFGALIALFTDISPLAAIASFTHLFGARL